MAQIEAGVDAVQVFDSWVGALSPADYREFAMPHTKRIFDAVARRVPTIHFGTGTSVMFPELREAGGDVIGVDWRIPIDQAWDRIGHDRAVQGNLDPTLLLGPTTRLLDETSRVLERVGGRPGHIFNLGHGILPSTPVEQVQMLAQYVHSTSRRTQVSTTVDVAVIGGGIAGLAAAYELRLRGLDVRVLEASERPGGVVHTERFDGWVIDAGPDALLVQKPAGVALCRELGLGDRLVSTRLPRTAYVLRDGSLRPLAEGSFLGFPISLGALARSRLFTWRGKLRMACEVAVPRSTGDDESISSFVRRRFGTEALTYLAEPLLAGIHAGDVDRLSTRALFPRLLEAERKTGSVLRSLRGQPSLPPPPRRLRFTTWRYRRTCGRPGFGAATRYHSAVGTRHGAPAGRGFHHRVPGIIAAGARSRPERPGIRRVGAAARD